MTDYPTIYDETTTKSFAEKYEAKSETWLTQRRDHLELAAMRIECNDRAALDGTYHKVFAMQDEALCIDAILESRKEDC